jgi:WD40 repeat protein/transcriptional regulator with XRE-family HTH domain
MNLATSSDSLPSISNFGDLLKYLRRRQKLTQLELSITVGYSEAQISRLEKNLRLPDLVALKALFIPALHLENEPKLATRFLELAQSARQEDSPVLGIAPYKGLLFFDEPDSALFFGREVLTARLTEYVMNLALDASTRFLAVVGASGSGKSSLVRAGLAVTLKRAGWATRVFTPTANPLRILEINLNPAHIKDAERVLILVDQFEEVFTLCHDEIERIAFIEKLLASAQDPWKKISVVIALRADFYAHCAQYPLLRQTIATKQEFIGQMSMAELRRAIEEPARRGGWEFEPALVDRVLNDIGARDTSEPEPGALPLLSHALLATWERRRGRMLTLDGYRASGGVQGAIAETAESVFTDQLNQTQQEIARDVFLRLTELGQGTEDTRRRAALNELVRQSEEATQLRVVLNTLAEARLITLNEDSAEVAHEALIREWQRLHEWLTKDREGLLLHRHLTESAREWEVRGRDPAEQYRGARLAQVREWALANEARLNAPERAFLIASIEQEQHDVLEREAQRQRELAVAQKLADAEQQRAEIESQRAIEHIETAAQLRRRALYLTWAFSIALIMALTALFFGAQSRGAAITAQANERIAFSRELAAASISNLDVDPERSILLALEGLSVTYSVDKSRTTEAEDALRRALLASRVELTLLGHTDKVESVSFSPDGTRLATSSQDGTAKVWDVATGNELLSISTGVNHTNIAFSPNGTRLAVPSALEPGKGQSWSPDTFGTAKVWDIATGQELLRLRGHVAPVRSVAFSPDGTRLATASNDKTAKVWDAATGQELLTLRGHTSPLAAVTFSPDGMYVATASHDTSAKLWNAMTGQELHTFAGHSGWVLSVAFSPDGNRLATASLDRTAILWDTATGEELLILHGHSDGVTSVAFSPDGKGLATTSLDGKTKVWNVFTGQELFTLAGHTGWVVDVAFSPDGKHLATASYDGTAKVWNTSLSRELLSLSIPNPSHSPADYFAVALSPDGARVAAGFSNGPVKLWDVSNSLNGGLPTGKEILTLSSSSEGIRRLAFSPECISPPDANAKQCGARLATAAMDGSLHIWDAATGEELLTLRGHNDKINDLTFSPDGEQLATVGTDSNFSARVRVWDVSAALRTRRPLPTDQALLTLPLSAESDSVVFSPDGARLAVGTFDPSTSVFDAPAKVWDLTSGQELFSLRGQTGGVRALAFTSDGARLATAGQDGSVKVWDAETGLELLTLRGHTGPVMGVDFSPECIRPPEASAERCETLLATAGQDGTVKLWDAETGQELLALRGHTGPVMGVAFSPDGTRLFTAGADGAVRFYLVRIEDLVALAKSRLTRSLTAYECRQYLHREQCPTAP